MRGCDQAVSACAQAASASLEVVWLLLCVTQEMKAVLDNITVVTCHSIHALLSSLNEIAQQASTSVSCAGMPAGPRQSLGDQHL